MKFKINVSIKWKMIWNIKKNNNLVTTKNIYLVFEDRNFVLYDFAFLVWNQVM